MRRLVQFCRTARRARTSGLAGDQSGATIVEFALLAAPFFFIVGAILETALVFFAAQTLDSAVHDSSRLIRTGQAQQAGLSAETYKDRICARLHVMFECGRVMVKVHPVASFGAAGFAPPLDPETGEWALVESYDPGGATDIVLVEAYYKWPTIIAIPGLMTGVQPDGTRLLAAARIFRNEPF